MATKTISIDLEAYARLKSVQRENESFSQTIKRVIQKPVDVEQWLAAIAKNRPSDGALDVVEQVVAQRRAPQNMTRPPKKERKRGAA
jgi:predicted CopG family antitoxin